jgi:group I intron endonuclease
MACGIYLVRNKVNGRCYIGQAHDIGKRWVYYQRSELTKSHLGIAGAGLLRKAIKKHGITNFEFSILEELPQDNQLQMNFEEQFWISEFNTLVDNGGYNLTSGGGQKGTFSTISREKMSNSHIGLSHPSGMKGKCQTNEARRKMSENNKGKHSVPRGPMSEDQKQKIRNGWTEEARLMAAERARNQSKSIGWHHSEEAKKKMSECKKGIPAANKGVPRTESQKDIDRLVKLKKYLERDKLCIKCIHLLLHDIKYFVSANEAAVQLTGMSGAMTIVQYLLTDPLWKSPKFKSKAWQILKNYKVEYCSQEELLDHRPELG